MFEPVLLYDGDHTTSFGDRLFAVPIGGVVELTPGTGAVLAVLGIIGQDRLSVPPQL